MQLFVTIITIASINLSFCASAKADINYRLNTDIEPIHYTLEFIPYFNNTVGKESFTYDGKVQIELQTNKNGVKEITLHQEDLNITKYTLNLKPEGIFTIEPFIELAIQGVEYDLPTKKLNLKLSEELTPNKTFVLYIEFIGKLRTDMLGFYRSSYTDDNVKKWLASTKMEPFHARKAFPCFDEPRFKATFDIIVYRPSYFSPTISNTRAIQTTFDWSNGLVRERFERTPKMSTYLVAFVVSEFKCRENKYENLTVCARPPAYDQTKYSFDIGQETLANFDKLFNYSYNTQMNKLHMVAIPDFVSGAMENWGLITYRETALLYQPGVSASKAQQRVASVVAHEQTHMWFGDLVTCEWWSHTWLNEGFATFFAYFALAMIEKDWGLDQQFVIDELQSVFAADSLNDTFPLSYEVTTPEDIQDRFGSISYKKGGSVIRMVEHTLGHDTFIVGLQKYLRANALSTSVPEKLYAALQEEAGNAVNITNFFGSWVSQPGYPVLHVQASDDRKSVKISQKRFLRNYDQQEKEENRILWHIPLTYATNKHNTAFNTTKTTEFLSGETAEINLKESVDWVIFNVQQSGYYRVNYDDNSWSAIDKVLHASHRSIHVLNRAQIVDDALNLARARHLNYKKALNTIRYLKQETDYVPWLLAFNNFGFLLDRFKDNEAPQFISFVLDLLTNVYDHLGFQPKQSDSRLDIYNRINVLDHACKFGHKQCLKSARDEYDNLVKGNYSVPVDLRPVVVYCSAITEGGKNEWDFMWNKLKNENVAAEIVVILNALGCTKKAELTKNYLNLILTDDVRLQDKHAAFISTLKHRENLELVLDFVIEHHKRIREVFEKQTEVPLILSSILTRLTTDEQFDKVSKFAKENDFESNKSLQTSLKNAKFNLQWAKENIPDIKAGISNNDNFNNDDDNDDDDDNSGITNTSSCVLLLSAIFAAFFNYY